MKEGNSAAWQPEGLRPFLWELEMPWSLWKVREGLGIQMGSEGGAADLHGGGPACWASPCRTAVRTIPSFSLFKSLLISSALHRTQNYAVSLQAFLLFSLLDLRLLVLKWEIRDLLWRLYNDLGKLRIPFSPTQGIGFLPKPCVASALCWKWPNKSSPSLGNYGQGVDCPFMKHTFTNGIWMSEVVPDLRTFPNCSFSCFCSDWGHGVSYLLQTTRTQT